MERSPQRTRSVADPTLKPILTNRVEGGQAYFVRTAPVCLA
jgi:hypothetical protein